MSCCAFLFLESPVVDCWHRFFRSCVELGKGEERLVSKRVHSLALDKSHAHSTEPLSRGLRGLAGTTTMP